MGTLEDLDMFYSDESKWCKNSLFKDKNGNVVHNVKDVYSCCISGAISYVNLLHEDHKLLLNVFIGTFGNTSIVIWNDSKHTKFSHLKQLIENAIRAKHLLKETK